MCVKLGARVNEIYNSRKQSVMFSDPVVNVDVPVGHGVQLVSTSLSLNVATGQFLHVGFIGSDLSRYVPGAHGTETVESH